MRIVLSTFGTFGDVNPLIALALELKRRGHRPALAVPEMFRAKIEPLGLDFFSVRPNQDQTDKRLVALIAAFDRLLFLVRGKFERSAKVLAVRLGARAAFSGARANKIALEFRQAA